MPRWVFAVVGAVVVLAIAAAVALPAELSLEGVEVTAQDAGYARLTGELQEDAVEGLDLDLAVADAGGHVGDVDLDIAAARVGDGREDAFVPRDDEPGGRERLQRPA